MLKSWGQRQSESLSNYRLILTILDTCKYKKNSPLLKDYINNYKKTKYLDFNNKKKK